MENQHRKISGYRELTQEEIDLMNRIKSFGPELENLCNDLFIYTRTSQETNPSKENLDLIMYSEAFKWIEIGRNSLQVGLMGLTRSVAKPTFF